MRKKLPVPSTSSSSSGGGSDELVKLMGLDGAEDDTVTGDEVLVECSIAQEILLVTGYETEIPKFEEFSVEFVANLVHHPVISCFRELGGADISNIISNSNINKLKKRMVNLELGVAYLGLIDYLAFSVDNPLLPAKIHNIPAKVQKLMMEFKNILGSWGFSEKEQLKNRYILVMSYLRGLIPRFQKIGFTDAFAKFLDAIDREVAKTKQNAEMIKALSSSTSVVTSTISSNSPTAMSSTETSVIEVEDDNVPHKIELDISMEIDDNLEDDEINGLPTPKPIPHTGQTSIESYFTGDDNSTSPLKKQPRHAIYSSLTRKSNLTETDRKGKGKKAYENKTKKVPLKLMLKEDPVLQKSSTVSQSPLSQETISITNPAKNELSPRKKPRLDIENVENEVGPIVVDAPALVPKPKVNAFTLLMNRSKELSNKNKPQKKATSSKTMLKSSFTNS